MPQQALRRHRLPAADEETRDTSPVGADASAMPAIPIAEGFNLGYCKAKPGKGPLMHNHDTNETFIAMTGRWRCEWNEGDAMRIRRPRSLRRHLLPGRRRAPLHERHLRRAGQGAPADVHHRRQPAAGRVHPRRDAALRSVRQRTSSTTSVASSERRAPRPPRQSGEGWSCA